MQLAALPDRRLIGGLGQQAGPLTFTASGLIPTAQLPSQASGEGFYRTVPGQAWTTTGRTLGEEAQGTNAFSVSAYLRDVVKDATPYPNIDNVVGYLEMARVRGLEWSMAGNASVSLGNQTGDVLRATFYRASFPGPGTSMASNGPNASNTANTLPAYRLAASSAWTVTYVVSYDVYGVVNDPANGINNQYQFQYRMERYRIGIRSSGSPYATYRILGGQTGGALQSTQGLEYCRTEPFGNPLLDGYIPVPVIELQTVLR